MSMPKIIEDFIHDFIIEEEGGFKYTDRTNDLDQGTFAGVRYIVFAGWLDEAGEHISASEFKEIASNPGHEKHEAMVGTVYEIYYEDYYPNRFDIPHYAVGEMLFSCKVNCGAKGFGVILQNALNKFGATQGEMLKVDGVVGPKTLYVANHRINLKHVLFVAYFCDEWMRHYINIVQANTIKLISKSTTVNQSANLEGWFNRVTKYRYKV